MSPRQSGPRGPSDRRRDVLARLEAGDLDGWIATASLDAEGLPSAHLVPLSIAWIGGHVIIAVDSNSRTACGITETGAARVGVGPTRDVIMIDTRLEAVAPVSQASAEIADGYASLTDWDPRTAGDGYVYISLRPQRIQAWREVDELPGRTLMRAGAWTC